MWYTISRENRINVGKVLDMAVDMLQEKIRKTKNPSVLELNLAPSDVPSDSAPGQTPAADYGKYCLALLDALKGMLPAVRVGFSSFALLGPEGMETLTLVLKRAAETGYYVILDAPEIWSPGAAENAAEQIFRNPSRYPCDGILLGSYLGSDCYKPFLPYCREENKDLFAVVRTANKSAPELQDLLAGARLVHSAAADHVNRYAGDMIGKWGYSRVGIVGAASGAESLRNLRKKYPKLFLLVDGYDYPNANAKNCANAFDKFGHGAAVCSGRAIACAWKQGSGVSSLHDAQEAAERMKRNLCRYITIL